MAKFGELIDLDIPVLINFYRDNQTATSIDSSLTAVAKELGEQTKIVKINVDNNKQLTKALKIKGVPTFMVYRKGEMLWRQDGAQTADTLIAVLQNYL